MTTRLLQAMAGPNPGGAELFFVRLASAFARAEVEQHLLVRRAGHAAGLLRKSGIAHDEIPFGGWVDFTTRDRFRAAIEAFRPTIVLTWMNRATRFCPPATRRRPFVHVGRLGGYYDLKYYRRCDHVFGNTQAIVDYVIERGFPRSSAHYAPNFVLDERAAAVPRQQHGTPEGVPLVLALGRLHRNKGFDVLLRAVATLPSVYLWIGGSGPLAGELKSLCRTLGIQERVRFLGWRDDAAALYAACDVFVCSSRIEPLGNVVIEAWAHERPVVAAASIGPDALVAEGENGLKVPVDDAAALASAIGRVLANPNLRAKLVAGGLASYRGEYTEGAVVGRYLSLFSGLVTSCAG
ncbi:MAG: glycosyltransferase [Alphaproteobacteria bacterium]|nr:glycosyltransferase [Alphaproteobacteria bacterium]